MILEVGKLRMWVIWEMTEFSCGLYYGVVTGVLMICVGGVVLLMERGER